MKRLTTALLFVVLLPGLAIAQAIPKAYQDTASRFGIPPAVLYGIALTESRRSTRSNAVRPWPWTLNVKGESFFFETRAKAQARIDSLLDQGMTRFDVGLMQVHWHFHRQRFNNDSTSALDPYQNLKVGAEILVEAWQETGSLWKAVGRYHSGTPDIANAYRGRFGEQLTNLLAHTATNAVSDRSPFTRTLASR